MPFWGFNYSKMANYRFLMDSNTFWMDSGTSKILSKSGPVAFPIIIKTLLKNQEKCGNILEIYEFGISDNLKISNFPEVVCTQLQDCVGLFLFCCERSFLCFALLILDYSKMAK